MFAWACRIGATITTGPALIFVAATVDDYLRAFNVRNGKDLWRTSLPAGGQATPATYMSPRAAGSSWCLPQVGSIMGIPVGDYVVAYTLCEGVEAAAMLVLVTGSACFYLRMLLTNDPDNIDHV